jgi:hypothetical protein
MANARSGWSGMPGSWKPLAVVAVLLVALLAASDYAVGLWQKSLVQRKKDYRARLDRLAFYAVRTGIDTIRFDPVRGYRTRFIVQNASDEPIYVMMPAVEAAIQVGPLWVNVPVAEPAQDASEGSVVRLVGERTADRFVTIERTDYTESIPGYIHIKFTLECLVSPEQDPQEEVGERKEDLIVYLKDYRHAGDFVRHGGRPTFSEKPDFIPLRAWTLVPRAS